MALAVVAVLVITAAAAGIYFFISSDDGKDEWNGLDFSDPMIQGTLGIGTEYTYDYRVNDGPVSKITMTIIGQSGSYYVYKIGNIFEIDDKYGMIHKETGKLRFSESDGTDGEYEGKPLTKWKLNLLESTVVYKTGDKDVVEKTNTYMVFSSNSESILPYRFEVHYEFETDGQSTQDSYVVKAELTEKDLKDPTGYEASKHIGDRARYSIAYKEDDKKIAHSDMYGRVVGDVGSKYLAIEIYEINMDSDEKSQKGRMLSYDQ